MITLILPIAAGNALRVFLEPPSGSKNWRILRKAADTFTGYNDTGALLVYEGVERSVLDTQELVNGTLYYYRAYYWNGATWTASATESSTPGATYQDNSTDAMTVVRDRLVAGLAVEIARNTLKHDDGVISVMTAPPIFEDTRWPVVTVHLRSESPAERSVGEMLEPDTFDAGNTDWLESEGWLARVNLDIVGWTLNPDERIELRKALRRIVVANLTVFDAAGMVQIEFSQQDVDAVSGEYPAPVYQVMSSFSCLAPVRVGGQIDAIEEVEFTVNPG